VAAPGLATDYAESLQRDLPNLLKIRFPGEDWKVEVVPEPLAGPPGQDVDLVQIAWRRMIDQGWSLAVCLTDLPIHVGRRPVTAHVSVTLAVGLISVPALGAVATGARVRQTVLRVIEGLSAESERGRHQVTAELWRRPGLRARLRHVAFPVGKPTVREQDTIQFLTDTTRGNLRLVLGMVRANRPWRFITGLSRALVAALAAAALTVTSPGVWRISNGLTFVRLLILSVGVILGTTLLLIGVHRLFEPLPRGESGRDRVMLFNIATALTIGLGVLAHYVALFLLTLLAAVTLIAPPVLAHELGHAVGLRDYLRLVCLVTILGTIGGALGAAVESDQAVREAAYGYRAEEHRPGNST
jgi:hypothetical protein